MGGESITFGSRALFSRIAASVDAVLRELLLGMVGTWLPGCPRLDVREMRDPTLLGSSMPPPVSIGPSMGGISEIRFESYAKGSSSLKSDSLSLDCDLRFSLVRTLAGATALVGLFWLCGLFWLFWLFFDSGESG
jgi:hypothetical protein